MSDFTTTPPNADYQLTVAVRPEYLPDQSEPAAEHYVFAYHVTITNTGRVAAQVVSRHWIITDGDGREEQVKGLAVVGYQPVLKPGEKFEYTSGTPLRPSREVLAERSETIQTRWGLPATKWMRVFKPLATSIP